MGAREVPDNPHDLSSGIGGERIVEPIRTGPDSDSLKGYSDLWSRQEEAYEFDFGMYNSAPWLIAKTVFSLCIITLAYLLYGLHEMPWTIYGSGTGLLILILSPFFAGMMLGYSFEKPKWALAYAIIIGFLAIGLNFFLMILPDMIGAGDFQPGFMSSVWWYGFYLPFMITISCVPAGAMLAASTNAYE